MFKNIFEKKNICKFSQKNMIVKYIENYTKR